MSNKYGLGDSNAEFPAPAEQHVVKINILQMEKALGRLSHVVGQDFNRILLTYLASHVPRSGGEFAVEEIESMLNSIIGNRASVIMTEFHRELI